MKNKTLEIGRNLNREIVEEMRQIEQEFPEMAQDLRRELNKERIDALGLYLIRGGEYEE